MNMTTFHEWIQSKKQYRCKHSLVTELTTSKKTNFNLMYLSNVDLKYFSKLLKNQFKWGNLNIETIKMCIKVNLPLIVKVKMIV